MRKEFETMITMGANGKTAARQAVQSAGNKPGRTATGTAVMFLSLLATGATARAGVIQDFFAPAGGLQPSGPVTMDVKGNLYGTTNVGGAAQLGTVYKLTPPVPGQTSWQQSVLYNFLGSSDGAYPYGNLVTDAVGNVYGITYGNSNLCTLPYPQCSVVFKLSPPSGSQTTWTETTIGRFGQSIASPGLLLGPDGSLYGGAYNYTDSTGTIFRLTPPPSGQSSWTNTTLYQFSGGADGGLPYGPLIMSREGALYGTTTNGGAPCNYEGTATCGVVFKLSPPVSGAGSWAETVLHSFNGVSDGYFPASGVIADRSGHLFGTTEYGGSGMQGVVFELTPPAPGASAWTETTLRSFSGIPDGRSPNALVMDGKGDLIGTTAYGGGTYGTRYCEVGCGAVFELAPPAPGGTQWTQTHFTLATPKTGGDLNAPYLGSDGNLYITSEYLGPIPNSQGTVIQVTPPSH